MMQAAGAAAAPQEGQQQLCTAAHGESFRVLHACMDSKINSNHEQKFGSRGEGFLPFTPP